MTRVLATAVLLGLSLLCMALAQQQAATQLAGQAINHWREQPIAATAAYINRQLERANGWPDPDARLLRGRWLAMPHAARDLNLALESLHSAATLRPTWYRPWEAIAVLRSRLDAGDPRWLAAADEALVRGPNESRLFATLFPIWRLHWHRLTAAQQRQVHALVISTAWREPALVFQLAEKYGYVAPLCADAHDNRLVSLRCVNMGWSSADHAD